MDRRRSDDLNRRPPDKAKAHHPHPSGRTEGAVGPALYAVVQGLAGMYRGRFVTTRLVRD